MKNASLKEVREVIITEGWDFSKIPKEEQGRVIQIVKDLVTYMQPTSKVCVYGTSGSDGSVVSITGAGSRPVDPLDYAQTFHGHNPNAPSTYRLLRKTEFNLQTNEIILYINNGSASSFAKTRVQITPMAVQMTPSTLTDIPLPIDRRKRVSYKRSSPSYSSSSSEEEQQPAKRKIRLIPKTIK